MRRDLAEVARKLWGSERIPWKWRLRWWKSVWPKSIS